MDPYVEMQEWEDFHNRFNTAIADTLQPAVRPRYVVRVERRVYVDHPDDREQPAAIRIPDVVLAGLGESDALELPDAEGEFSGLEPVTCTLPMPRERRESYLVIRDQNSMEVVTVIETLSPANKRKQGDGRREYLRKRDEVLGSTCHLVELDLLRGGDRLPMDGAVPAGDYYAIISRGDQRPRADVFAWTLRDPMPDIPIPLLPGDGDAMVSLAETFSAVYNRAAYELSLDYNADILPATTEADAVWARGLLGQSLD
jgi:hypothetical protein